MIQILVFGVAIGLIILGAKGFTQNGLQLTSNTRLNGAPGKIVGAICILLGLAFVPLFFAFFVWYGSLTR